MVLLTLLGVGSSEITMVFIQVTIPLKIYTRIFYLWTPDPYVKEMCNAYLLQIRIFF